MRSVKALAITIALAIASTLAAAAPAVSQTDARLCLMVQASTDVNLTDASAVQEGIGTGDVLVTQVVPCDGGTTPSPSPTPVPDAETGAWSVAPIEVDLMTDDRRALVSLAAGGGVTGSGQPITLTIACMDGSTELTAGWGWDLGSERLIDVEQRIGDGHVTTERWFIVGDGTAYGGVDTSFIESLYGETRLVLRLMTNGYGQSTAVFDISGIENAVAGVREACGW